MIPQTAIEERSRSLVPANDNLSHRYRGGLPPCIAKLARTDPEGAWSVLEFGKTFSPEMAIDHGGHDDDERFDGKRFGGDADDFRVDVIHETKPSILEMLADVLRPRFIRHMDGTTTRHAGPSDIQFDGDTGRLGSLVFHFREGMRRAPAGGNIFSYRDATGKTQISQVIAKRARQARQSSKETAPLWAPRIVEGKPGKRTQPDRHARYLDLGSTPFPTASPAPYVNDGRPPLKEQRPDMPFHQDCRYGFCAPAVARGAHWMAGLVKGRPSAQMPAPMPDRPRVPQDTANVLEMAMSRSTYDQIGRALGYRDSYADIGGKRAFLSAVEVIKTLFPPPARAKGWESHLAKLQGEEEEIDAIAA